MATATTPRTADPETKILSRRIAVEIRRDQTTSTPRVVWQHEVPILQVIHGEDEVREVSPEQLDESYSGKPTADLLPFNKVQDALPRPSIANRLGWVFTGSPDAEYQRLAAAYGRHVDVNQPNVESVYGRFASGAFARVIGKPALEDLPADQLRDLVLNWGHSLPVATSDSTSAEQAEAKKAWAEFRALPAAALVKLARELGVTLG